MGSSVSSGEKKSNFVLDSSGGEERGGLCVTNALLQFRMGARGGKECQ